MKSIGKKIIRVVAVLAAIATMRPELAIACYGPGCSGGGSVDASTQIVLEAFLANSRMLPHKNPVFNTDGGDPGLEAIYYNVSRTIPDWAIEVGHVIYDKPWYVIDFDQSILQKFSKENQRKLSESGFLRSADMKALQVGNAIFLDKKYYEEQMRLISSGTEEEKLLARKNLRTLFLKEIVRSKEVATRAAKDEKTSDAVGRGGYHRMGMPPMDEDGVWRLTQAMELAYRQANDGAASNGIYQAQYTLQDALEETRYGYYLKSMDAQKFDSQKEAVEEKLIQSCGLRDFADVLEIIQDLHAIARNGTQGSSAYKVPNISTPIRVEFFELLNSYLDGTSGGRLKNFSDNFPLTEDTAKGVCRILKSTYLVRHPQLGLRLQQVGEDLRVPASVQVTNRSAKDAPPEAGAAGESSDKTKTAH